MNKVNIKEKEIEKIGFDHDRDKVYNTTNKKMTNEKKAAIGSITIMTLIVISLLIHSIREFFVKLVLGTFLFGITLFIIWWIYNIFYHIIEEILDWLDERKQNKE